MGWGQELVKGEVALFQGFEVRGQELEWDKSRQFVLLLSLFRVGSDRLLYLLPKNANGKFKRSIYSISLESYR